MDQLHQLLSKHFHTHTFVHADCCSLLMKSYLVLDNCDYVLEVDLGRLGNYNVNEIKLWASMSVSVLSSWIARKQSETI